MENPFRREFPSSPSLIKSEEMLKAVFKPGALYRATGIVLSNLEEDGGLQFEAL